MLYIVYIGADTVDCGIARCEERDVVAAAREGETADVAFGGRLNLAALGNGDRGALLLHHACFSRWKLAQ